jgi:protein-arginine kinase activator protein McsA
MTICPECKAKDSIVSVEEALSHFKISVADGVIDYDGTSERHIHSEIVDYQCVECNASFSEDAVLEMEVKQ